MEHGMQRERMETKEHGGEDEEKGFEKNTNI